MKCVIGLCLLCAACASSAHRVSPGDDLRAALAEAASGRTLQLQPGHYFLEPVAYTDTTCGNCQDASEDVPATAGLQVSGTRIRIEGTHRDSVFVHTRAGYGILFENCTDCSLAGVTVTDGRRDDDGRATSAAIVIKHSTVHLQDCALRDNIGDSATVARVVVGIAGVAVREGGRLVMERCEVIRNSWDGVAMYRSAHAALRDNVIDGVDKAAGGRVGGGRGVGIGLTWDAQAVVERNLVTRYWKGIGVFVDADADVRENIVEDILTWGIALWGPDSASASARIERNVVHTAGACGIMIERVAGRRPAGSLAGNLIVRSGQNPRYDSGEPYCWQRPIARHNVPGDFGERDNLLHDNRQPLEAGAAPAPLPELARSEFDAGAQALLTVLRRYPVFRTSAALRQLLPE